MKKTLFQLQYEFDDERAYSEQGAEQGAKLSVADIEDEEVRNILQQTAKMTQKELLKWLSTQKENYPQLLIVPLTTSTPEALRYRFGDQKPKLLYLTRPLHTLENLNKFLYTAN